MSFSPKSYSLADGVGRLRVHQAAVLYVDVGGDWISRSKRSTRRLLV